VGWASPFPAVQLTVIQPFHIGNPTDDVMNMLGPLWLKYRPHLFTAVALLTACLYAWQTAVAWAGQVLDEQSTGALSAPAGPPGRGPGYTNMVGVGVGAGASGTITFAYNRGGMGTLVVQDMPSLPETLLYELWCVDDQGNIVPSSVFRITAPDQGSAIISASAPQMLVTYPHFFITVERGFNKSTPSGPVVMQN
jgi:hypothetical protein